MLIIDKNTSNNIIVSLSHIEYDPNNQYVFKLTKDSTLDEQTVDVIITRYPRFDQFSLIEGTDITLDTGFYQYEVISNSFQKTAEEGLLLVKFQDESYTEYQTTSQDYVEYNG